MMLDAALVLSESALGRTLEALESLRGDDDLRFFFPESLRQGVADETVYRFFDAVEDPVDAEQAAIRLEESGVPSFAVPPQSVEEFSGFYALLGDLPESGAARDILFAEWFFLTHRSWLVSRLKKPFGALVDAGELGVEVLNKMTRKTLKKGDSETLRAVDRLRALGKWIAVGGPPAATLLNPIAGAVTAGVAGGFLLLDPPVGGSEPAFAP